jgi:formylglycine-generating enzyme required for sulfatase activity
MGKMEKNEICVFHCNTLVTCPSSPGEVIDRVVEEMKYCNPSGDKRYVVVCDGDRGQRKKLLKGIPEATMVLDLMHVLEKLWKVSYLFYAEGSEEAKSWVRQQALTLLQGKVDEVIAQMRQKALEDGLSRKKEKKLEKVGSPESEEGRWRGEGPRHLVTISQGYWLFDTPVILALWQAVMGNDPSWFQAGSRHPVEMVSWENCQQFLEKLSQQVSGLTFALPTEAQWEYACRAGTQTARYGELDAIAWYDQNSEGQPRPVAEKEPNAWGLYDMLGNVREWCLDGIQDYTPDAVTDPLGPTDAGAHRVLRGGSWEGDAGSARAAVRTAGEASYDSPDMGFRCCASLLP